MDLTHRSRRRFPRLQESATREFLRALFEEHVEELSILWRLRVHRLGSPDYRLVDLTRLDERIEAHADAIVSTGEPDEPLIATGLNSNDRPEVFASAYTILRAGLDGLRPLLRDLFGRVDATPDTLKGLRDALVHAPGSSWMDVVNAPPPTSQRTAAITTEVLGFRGAPDVDRVPLSHFLASDDPFVRACGWEAAAHGLAVPAAWWTRGFEDSSRAVRLRAFEAAAWQGHQPVLVHLRDATRTASAPDEMAVLAFAWLAEEDDSRMVLDAAWRLPAVQDQVHAVSALGHPSAIPRLIEMLTDGNPKTAVAAARALTRITGWDLDSDRKATVLPADAPPGDEFAEAFDQLVVLPDADRGRALWNAGQGQFAAASRWSRGIDVSRGLPQRGLRLIDLESLKACCLRARMLGSTAWTAARLDAFPQPRV